MNEGDAMWMEAEQYISMLEQAGDEANAEGARALLGGGRLLVHSSGTSKGSSKQIVYDVGRFLAGMGEVARALRLSPERVAVSFV